MTPDPGNPTGIAEEEWNDVLPYDDYEQLVASLADVDECYHEEYGMSPEEAAFRVAAEFMNWWRSAGWDQYGFSTYTADIIGIAHTNLWEKNHLEYCRRLVGHVEREWDRCRDWRDAHELTLEASLGAALLRRAHDESLFEDATTDSVAEHPDPRPEERDDWQALLTLDWEATRDRMKEIYRNDEDVLTRLESIAQARSDGTDQSIDDARLAVCREYARVQTLEVLLLDTFHGWTSLYFDDGEVERRLAEAFEEGIDARTWLRRWATVFMHRWVIDDQA